MFFVTPSAFLLPPLMLYFSGRSVRLPHIRVTPPVIRVLFAVFVMDSSMEGLTLVARAHGARKDWQAVVGVLATAEEACSSTAVAAAAASDYSSGGEATEVAARHPPAELYEVVARSLALAGKWEEAASAVRRLEVRVCACLCAVFWKKNGLRGGIVVCFFPKNNWCENRQFYLDRWIRFGKLLLLSSVVLFTP